MVSHAFESEKWCEATEVEHHLIAYRGSPLSLPSGDIFGTICIHDDKKNVFSEEIILKACCQFVPVAKKSGMTKGVRVPSNPIFKNTLKLNLATAFVLIAPNGFTLVIVILGQGWLVNYCFGLKRLISDL